jgi:uncharacterized membrane protein
MAEPLADGQALIVVLAMAVVTYGTRIGGFWIMRFMPVTPGMEAFLRYLSGSVLVAILAPAVLQGGLPAAAAALFAALVMIPARNMLAAMAAGVMAAALVRALIG